MKRSLIIVFVLISTASLFGASQFVRTGRAVSVTSDFSQDNVRYILQTTTDSIFCDTLTDAQWYNDTTVFLPAFQLPGASTFAIATVVSARSGDSILATGRDSVVILYQWSQDVIHWTDLQTSTFAESTDDTGRVVYLPKTEGGFGKPIPRHIRGLAIYSKKLATDATDPDSSAVTYKTYWEFYK